MSFDKLSLSNLIFFLLFFTHILFANNYNTATNESSDTGLFSSDVTLDIILKTDLRSLIRNKFDDEYQEGEITIDNNS